MEKHRARRGLFYGGILLFCGCGLYRPQLLAALLAAVRDIALPPLLGGLLAMLLAAPWKKLSQLLGGSAAAKAAALALCYLAVLGAAAGLALLLTPTLAQTALLLGEHSADYAANLHCLLQALADRLSLPPRTQALQQKLLGQLFLWLAGRLQLLLGQLLDLTADLLKTLLQMTLGLFFSIYLLTDGPLLARQAADALFLWLPHRRAGQLVRFFRLCRRMLYGWLVGQLLDCLLLGAACGLGMAVLRLPFPALIGLLTGVCNLIPMVGGFLGGALSFFLLLAVQPLQAVWFVVYYLILQQLEGRFLYPRIVGSRLGLPPLLVLFSVLCGGELGGFWGVLLALPLAAVIYAAARSAARHKRQLSKSAADTENEVPLL